MSTVSRPPDVTAPPPRTPAAAGQDRTPVTRIDLVVLGLLVSAAGVGWLMTVVGVDVPWALAVPVALLTVGLVLIVTVVARADGGRDAGRSGLAWLGAVLLVTALALGVDAPRYAAPMGNVDLAPAAAEWPVSVHRSTGNIDVDLTRHPLPDQGSLEIQLGAGNVDVSVPRDGSVTIDARVTAGTIRVDGSAVEDGVDLRWSSDTPRTPVVVTIDVGAGEVAIRHA
jgi:hypothetical protein